MEEEVVGRERERRDQNEGINQQGRAEEKTHMHGREALVDVFLGEGEPEHTVNASSQIPALDHLYEELRADWREALQGLANFVPSRCCCLLCPLCLFFFPGRMATVRLCGIPKLIL